MLRKRGLLIVVVVIILLSSIGVRMLTLNGPTNVSNVSNTPAHDYAIQCGVSSDLADIMSQVMDKDGVMDQYERLVIENIASLGHYMDSPVVHTTLESMLSDGVTYSDVQGSSDIDQDGITNKLELQYGTNPTKADSLGLGLPDFFARYVYNVPWNDTVAVKAFLTKVPHVVANNFHIDDGGYAKTWDQIAKLSTTDPVIKSLDKQIKWSTNAQGTRTGEIYVNGNPLSIQYGDSGTDTVAMPSYYFTHGQKGTCVPENLASLTIMKLMGYKCVDVGGEVQGVGHDWSEVEIDGHIYVESGGFLFPREGYYESNGWVPVSNYNPDWYMSG